ncbi:MAG: flavin reductase [Bosea sp. (in: a-proteobacteria)]
MTKTTTAEFAPASAPLDAKLFRDSMAEITASVHVITTAGPMGRRGLTASAVTSLSDTPPTMLVCIHADSQTLGAIEANGSFCINALSGTDEEVAQVFAGRRGLSGEERFSTGQWGTLTTGAPRLMSALVTFDCKLIEARHVATHKIVLGEVVAIAGPAHVEGLIYRNRRFGRF